MAQADRMTGLGASVSVAHQLSTKDHQPGDSRWSPMPFGGRARGPKPIATVFDELAAGVTNAFRREGTRP